MASYVKFETRCYEIAKGNELFNHLADSGIASYDDIYRVLRAPGRELTNSEIFGCACDIFLTDFPTQKQILWLRLLIVESKEIIEHWASWRTTDGDPQAHAQVHLQLQFDLNLRTTLRLKGRQLALGVGRLHCRLGLRLFLKQPRKTRAEPILESLREWSRLQITITELSGHLLNAPWRSDLFQMLHESVVFWLAHRMRESLHFRPTLQRPCPLPKQGQQASSLAECH